MTSGLLSRPPEEGARLLALRQLEAAVAARGRLADPEDLEALHDLRVALRRLRSTLRSYRPYLAGSLSKKLGRRLRDLAAATGPGRDAEVQVAWLRGEMQALTRTQRSGAAWLLARLSQRMTEGYGEAHEALEDRLPGLADALRARLSVYSAEVHLETGEARPTFGAVTGHAVRSQLEELRQELSAISSPADEEHCHEARITAKRIRYLLEPLLEELPEIAPLVKRFKALQDGFGELHDAHVLEHGLGEALESAAAERARLLFHSTVDEKDKDGEARLRSLRRHPRDPGLLALVLLNRKRRDALFATIHERYLEGRGEPFLTELNTLALRLEAGAPPEA